MDSYGSCSMAHEASSWRPLCLTLELFGNKACTLGT
uniref:Uncharacterized protein n=1 Tax=Anguilla anguilla TaxID=7936 RepID=A0A0E9WNC3_ANGAN